MKGNERSRAQTASDLNPSIRALLNNAIILAVETLKSIGFQLQEFIQSLFNPVSHSYSVYILQQKEIDE